MNSWVISDIHGCFMTFKTLVEDKIHLTKDDELFLLGDYIDRGKKSKQLIDYIIDLQNKNYSIQPIMGNHEWFLLQAYEESLNLSEKRWIPHINKAEKNWLSYGGKETLESFGIKSVKDIPKQYIDWISTLPYYRFSGSYIMVHAGLNFQEDDLFSDTYSMMFSYNFQVDHKKLGERIVIHGHYPIGKTFFDEQKRNYKTDGFLDLDLGCVYVANPEMGILTALNLKTMDVIFQENIDN